MERQESIVMTRDSRQGIKLVIIFHAVGLIGLSVPVLRPYFLAFVPWHLLIMFIVLVANHHPIDAKFAFFFILMALAGFTIEYTGVHRHWPFGDYRYGQTLGWKIAGVPGIIGINWFLLAYSVGVAMRRSKLKRPTSRVVIGAMLLVLLDLLIEPVAVKLDYWHWAGGVPLSNYISWFIISAIMLGIFELFKFKRQSPTAPVFLLVQFLFFAILNLIL